MKVLFSNPPWFVGDREGIRAGSRWPHTRSRSQHGYYCYPFFLGYAASYLKDLGHDSIMRDSIVTRESYGQYLEYIMKSCFDYIFIETSSSSWEYDKKLIEDIDRMVPAQIVLVGPHATYFAEEVMKEAPIFAVIKGEYEKNAFEIVETGKGGVYDYNLIEDLNARPFPYRDENIYKYWDAFPNTPSGHQLQMWTSRGCPWKCIFCAWPPTMYGGNKYRTHSLNYIYNEVSDVLKRFPDFKSIYIDDDTTNVGDKHTSDVCEAMRKIGLPWAAMCRADSCSKEMFKEMKESGCYAVKFGVESGSPKMIEICNKKLDLDRAKEVIRYTKELGIFVHLTFTWDMPGETEEDKKLTTKFIEETSPNSWQQSCCAPFPGTSYYEKYIKGKVNIDFSKDLDGQWKLEK